jgi:hypothetical protein
MKEANEPSIAQATGSFLKNESIIQLGFVLSPSVCIG